MKKPTMNLIINKGITLKILLLSNKINKASSLQAKKTLINVPIVIFLFIYKSLAATLTPHCGISPINAPNNGDVLEFELNFLLINSSLKYQLILVSICHLWRLIHL